MLHARLNIEESGEVASEDTAGSYFLPLDMAEWDCKSQPHTPEGPPPPPPPEEHVQEATQVPGPPQEPPPPQEDTQPPPPQEAAQPPPAQVYDRGTWHLLVFFLLTVGP